LPSGAVRRPIEHIALKELAPSYRRGVSPQPCWNRQSPQMGTAPALETPIYSLHALRHVALRFDGHRQSSLLLPGVRPTLPATAGGSHTGLQKTH
jgi:hypothetical protein